MASVWSWDFDSRLTPIPFDKLMCMSARPCRLALTIDAEIQSMLTSVDSFEKCLRPEMYAKLREAERLVKLEISHSKCPFNSWHRLRARQGKDNVEVRIMPADWCEPVRRALERGYVLRVKEDVVTIWNPNRKSCEDFGFNAVNILEHAKRLQWPYL